MRFICIRHGETDSNADGLVQGHSDFPLNDTGEEQARDLRDFIESQDYGIDSVYTSDLERATHSADLIFPDHDIHTDERFREQDFGLAVGKLFEYLDENPEYRLTSPEAFSRRFPEGESIEDVYDRVKNWFEDIREQHDEDETLALVGHYTPMLCLRSLVLDEPLPETWAGQHFENGEIMVLAESSGQYDVEERHQPV